jgi:small-conductance mechanosensitive channel
LKRAIAVIACAIFLSEFAGSTVVSAAEPAKAPPQKSETKQASPAPVAIPDSEIIPRAEQTIAALQKIRSALAADSTLRSIQSDFAAFAERSDRRRESEDSRSKFQSLQRLNEMLRDWSLEQSQLDEWDQALARRLQSVAAQEKDIDRIIETWRATQDAVAKKFLFKAVLQRRVEEVLREVQATREVAQQQTSQLLKLQSQIADRLAGLAETRKEIDRAREEFGRSLFTRDRAPLWQALFQPEAHDLIVVQAVQSSQRFIEDLQAFIQKYSDRVLWHAVFFLAMILLFHFLRRGLAPEEIEHLGGSSSIFVFERLYASSFLLSLIAVPLFYPGAAATLLRIGIFPTVIPVVRLLPRLLPKISPRWIYLLVAIYVTDFLRYLLPAAGLLHRVLLLATATGGCIGIGLFLRSRGAERSATRSGQRVLLVVVQLGLFLLGASVVSNVVGNTTLAEALVSSPIRILYSAALIFAGAHLLMTLTAVALQSRLARWLRSVREHGELIASRCLAVIRLAASLLWVILSLHTVGILGDISAAGTAFLELRWKVGAAEISIQGLAAFFAVLITAVLVSRMFRFVLSEEILPRIRLPRGVPGAVDVLCRYGVLLLGFFIALAAAGVDLSKVTLLVSALGVGIGFGLQNVVNNFVSGLILVFEHPVQVGDFVEVGTTFGEVRKIGFRASVLRTPDGADVVIPNSELVGARFVNWSLSDWLRRINIPVSAAYGTDPDRVIEILTEVARKHPAVLANPAPMAVFDRFGDSALHFTLFCWSYVDRFFLARSDLTIAINNAFKEAGIQIPFPQQDVHVHWRDSRTSGDSAESQKDPTERKTLDSAPFVSGGRPVAKR